MLGIQINKTAICVVVESVLPILHLTLIVRILRSKHFLFYFQEKCGLGNS